MFGLLSPLTFIAGILNARVLKPEPSLSSTQTAPLELGVCAPAAGWAWAG